MISEPEFKSKLIEQLNGKILGWDDGDLNNQTHKSADIVNNKLKIAIEVKDDTVYKKLVVPTDGTIVSQDNDLSQISNRFKGQARDANKKFRNYQGYKSVLIIRTELIDRPPTVQYIMGGLTRYIKIEGQLVQHTPKNANLSSSSTSEVGAYLFVDNGQYYYHRNPKADSNRVIELEKLRAITGLPLKDLATQS